MVVSPAGVGAIGRRRWLSSETLQKLGRVTRRAVAIGTASVGRGSTIAN
jgi:hypothetical protein